MAPIPDIIFRILIDIWYFMVILILFGFVFAALYYLVAQNQVMFDDLSDKEKDDLNYKTLSEAIWFTYDIVLGGADRGHFDIG
jgi:NADH:ubiquinone oxidoreductase subunit 4 (subunit M)